MSNRKVKTRDSDDEQDVEEPTPAQQEAAALKNAPTIPDSEISPAAYIFQNQETHDDLNLYEEK